jgi:hypothetical protein
VLVWRRRRRRRRRKEEGGRTKRRKEGREVYTGLHVSFGHDLDVAVGRKEQAVALDAWEEVGSGTRK